MPSSVFIPGKEIRVFVLRIRFCGALKKKKQEGRRRNTSVTTPTAVRVNTKTLFEQRRSAESARTVVRPRVCVCDNCATRSLRSSMEK